MITVREALRDAIAEEMQADPDVFILGEDVGYYHGAYKVTQGLIDKFGPDRVIDTPISEQGFAGIAIGAAMAGLKPIVEFMTMNFAMQAIDQIVNSAAKGRYMSGGTINFPIVFRGPNGIPGGVGAQHSQCYASWYSQIPGLKVIAPYCAADSKALLKAAIRDPNPVIFLEHEVLYGQLHNITDATARIGEARIRRAGTDVTLVTFSMQVKNALEAAEILQTQHQISAEVIDLRTLRPLDINAILQSIRKTNRLVTVEEGWAFAGIGAEITAQVVALAFDDLDAPIARVSTKDVPMPYAANLERLAMPQIADIVQKALEVCYSIK